MKKLLFGLLISVALLVPSAGAVPQRPASIKAAPIYGLGPTIQQQSAAPGGSKLCVIDNASWFDPQTGGGTRATRYIHVWLWNGSNVFSVPTPPWNTKPPEAIQPGEGFACIGLGPTNIGGAFQVIEYGGIVSPAFGDNPAAVEWGREQSANREDQSKWGARSNTVVIQDWRQQQPPPPPPPPPPTPPQPPVKCTVEVKPVGCIPDDATARIILREEILRQRATGFTWDTVKRGPVYRAWSVLGGR